MGEKKRFRLPMDFPFYTQQMTQENWQEEQFPSFEEADHWTFRSCGIASLRMVLDGFGKQVERHGPMIEKGVAAGAYKDGVGWIHWGLAHMAEEYGIHAEALRGKAQIVYIDTAFEICCERIYRNPDRPLVKANTRESLKALYDRRDSLYRACADGIITNNTTPEESADMLCALIGK